MVCLTHSAAMEGGQWGGSIPLVWEEGVVEPVSLRRRPGVLLGYSSPPRADTAVSEFKSLVSARFLV